jgi:hypothetical protein
VIYGVRRKGRFYDLTSDPDTLPTATVFPIPGLMDDSQLLAACINLYPYGTLIVTEVG